MTSPAKLELVSLFFFLLGVFIWSAIEPFDRVTWIMEVFPAVVWTSVLVATYRKFPLTRLAYWLITLFSIVLMTGGHYTYAKVPLFDWIRDASGLSRNHFDRFGHFLQGFVPAIVTREILIRTSVVTKRGWLFFLVMCTSLAISAFYELIEWWAALIGGESAAAFLGTQGDVWDSQWDMFLALVGSVCAQLFLGKLHDRQIRQ